PAGAARSRAVPVARGSTGARWGAPAPGPRGLVDCEAVEKPGAAGRDEILLAAASRRVHRVPRRARAAKSVVMTDDRGAETVARPVAAIANAHTRDEEAHRSLRLLLLRQCRKRQCGKHAGGEQRVPCRCFHAAISSVFVRLCGLRVILPGGSTAHPR